MKAPTKFKPTYESKWNIVRGDVVKVIKGPQKGQQGKVLEVIRPKNRIIIDGVNMVSRSTLLRLNFYLFSQPAEEKFQS